MRKFTIFINCGKSGNKLIVVLTSKRKCVMEVVGSGGNEFSLHQTSPYFKSGLKKIGIRKKNNNLERKQS